MVRHHGDERRVEPLTAAQLVDDVAEAIVGEAQRCALGRRFAAAIEPVCRRRARVLVGVMAGRHVICGEERPLRVLATLPCDPVDDRTRRDALVDAPGVAPGAVASWHVVTVDHHIQPSVLQEPDFTIEREIA